MRSTTDKNHAQSARGTRDANAQANAQTTDETNAQDDANARMLALVSTLKSASIAESVNSLVSAHFSGDTIKFARSILKSLTDDARSRVLYQRVITPDKITFEIDGWTGSVSRHNGQWKQDGFLMSARDASGNVYQKRFGDGITLYDSVDTAIRNMFAGYRNGVIWNLNERETSRDKSSGTNDAQTRALSEKLAQAEARATQAEARATQAHAATEKQTEMLNAILARLSATDDAKAQAS